MKELLEKCKKENLSKNEVVKRMISFIKENENADIEHSNEIRKTLKDLGVRCIYDVEGIDYHDFGTIAFLIREEENYPLYLLDKEELGPYLKDEFDFKREWNTYFIKQKEKTHTLIFHILMHPGYTRIGYNAVPERNGETEIEFKNFFGEVNKMNKDKFLAFGEDSVFQHKEEDFLRLIKRFGMDIESSGLVDFNDGVKVFNLRVKKGYFSYTLTLFPWGESSYEYDILQSDEVEKKLEGVLTDLEQLINLKLEDKPTDYKIKKERDDYLKYYR